MTQQLAPAMEAPRRSAMRTSSVGIALDIGGIGDKSFNDAANAGSSRDR